jgi:hypothetical protein
MQPLAVLLVSGLLVATSHGLSAAVTAVSDTAVSR